MEGVKPIILKVALGFRVPSFGQKKEPMFRYILYCRRNKSLQRSIELQKGGLQGMIFCTLERYADDVIYHCVSEKQALYLRDSIKRRLAECRLKLHPGKLRGKFPRSTRPSI